MTKQELFSVLEQLEKFYKNFHSEKEKLETLDNWYPMFKDDDAGEVSRAATAYVCTNIYPPTVAGIKALISDERRAQQPNEMKAWSMIREAINNSSTKMNAKKAFAELPEILQKAIGNDSSLLNAWYKLDDPQLEMTVSNNVIRCYRDLAKHEAVYNAIPGQLQKKWRLESPKAEALPEPKVPDMKFDENGNRVLNIGFEPPEYMMPHVKRWMAAGESDAEIRKACVNFGSYSPASDAPKPEQEDDGKDKGMTLEEYLKLYPFEA